ncbi:hypothetical protein GBAR_LOCUS28998 [Geodia barretti]|uniref:Uncharacterized protein n=1 Tax=Geodia barretti TaxID=519541 RepID=A0AA35XHY6_GEOBA|nr:hypothetical protein GBAR_LOCUS28998 [Geodia barretti]
MAKLWAFAFLVVALCATGSRAQEESSKDKPKGSDATTEYPTLSPPPPPPDPLIHVSNTTDNSTDAESGNQTPPPTYKVMEMIAPPDYTDALQDVLVSQSKQEGEEEPSEETREGTSTVEVPLEDNEAEDDRTPLNP